MFRFLSQLEVRKTANFCVLNFLLGFGYICGFLASNSLLLTRVGPSSLFQVYLMSSLLTVFLSVIFYFFIDRFSPRGVLEASFFILGNGVFTSWVLIRYAPDLPYLFLGIRSFFYTVFVVAQIVFWMLAGHHFSHFEARRRFPALVSAGILGDMLGGLWISTTAAWFHTTNLILIWSAILIFAPLFFFKMEGTPVLFEKEKKPTPPLPFKKNELSSETISLFKTWLPLLLFLFWLIYTFICYGTDFLFNSLAVQKMPDEDTLTEFFGRLSFFANAVVLIYQLFFARRAVFRYGINPMLFLLTGAIAFFWGIAFFHPTLVTFTVAQGFIYFFADQAATARLGTTLSLFPEKLKGRVKVFSEGWGRPAGAILLYLVVTLFIPHREFAKVQYLVFGAVILLLAYPFFFRRIFFGHLVICIHSKDDRLVSNAIQALGERNKKQAIGPLVSLMSHTNSVSLKRNIILSLGQIRSRESFKEIVELFSTTNPSLQMQVLRALTDYDNYESMFALLKLVKFNPRLETEIRRNATLLLTRLVGRKMIPFLLEGCLSDDLRIKANAVEALGYLKDPKIIPILMPFLENPHHRIRANAALALSFFRTTRKRALQVIKELFESSELPCRVASLYVIGMLGLSSYEKALIPLLDSPEKSLRQHAAAALGKMKRSIFSSTYIQLLTDPDEAFALDTIRHLAQFPAFSRILVFEEISKLSEDQRCLVLDRIDKTPFDFTVEKEMLFSS